MRFINDSDDSLCMFKLHNNIDAIDIGIFVRPNTLIISDLHLGYEEMLAGKGTLVPRFQLTDIISRIDSMLENNPAVKRIVINGDLKHEFGSILRTEWRDILKFVDYCSQHAKEVIIIKGNHDVALEPITKKRNIRIVRYLKIKDILIAHGDVINEEAITKSIKTIIIGHEHPAIGLKDKHRYEKYKCFLKGKWKNKVLIVQPSMNPLTEGTDILREPLLSPYLKNIGKFEVFAVAKTGILQFGKVKDLSVRLF